nr:MAG TPA: hypothetical protein [Bacteriophage sp.]
MLLTKMLRNCYLIIDSGELILFLELYQKKLESI